MKLYVQFMIILVFSFLGEAISIIFHLPIPGSIIGLILLFLALEFKLIRLRHIHTVGNFLLANMTILTDDNPRTEEPAQIIRDMQAGLQDPAQVMVEHQREAAIRLALRQAGAGDLVLVAGKGHEDYQIIGKQKLMYSDRETVAQLVKEPA